MLEEDIAKRTVKMFPLGALTSRSRYEQLIREELSDIIRCAAEIVREYVDVSVYKADKGEEATEQNTSEPTNTDKTITGLPANETASNEEHPVDTTNSTSPEEDAPENGGINEADNVEQIAFEWDNGSNDDDSDSSDDDAGQDQEVDMIITGNTKWENDWDFLYCGGSERLILKTEIKIGADDWPWNRGKLFPEPPAAEEVTPVSKDWAKLVGIPYIGTVEDFSTDDSMESQRRVPSAASCGRDDTRYAETGKIRRRSLPWSEMESAQVTTAHAVVALGERKHASLVATVYTNEMAAYLKLTSGRLD